MFNFRPSPRGFGFNVKVPEEEVPGFRMNADGTVRDTPPRDVSTAFPGIDPDDSAALPGGIMFNVRPERYLPGLHNFRPPEEEVPGFRMNADGSIRDASAPLQVNPHVGDNPFGAFDRLGTNAFFPVGDGSPPPYPAHVPGLFNGLGRMPTLDKDEPAGTAVSPLSNSPSFPASGSDAMPPVTQPSPFLIGRLDTGDGPRPPSASLGYTANPSSTSEQHLPLPPFAGPVLSGGRSTMGPNTAGDTLPGALAAPDGPPTVSARSDDPNIIRVADGEPAVNDEILIAQQQGTPPSKLRKDPSPGVAVVLPDGSTIPHPESPTGKLMAPTADLSEVAAAGRKTGKQYLQMLETGNPLAIAYLGVAMESYLGHGGTFDYQRRGNWFTGYTHLQQFEAVSNLNVGLFGQQAGLTLDELLTIAGKFACNFSSNAKKDQPYCLDPRQLEFMTRGYRIGESGMFDRPRTP